MIAGIGISQVIAYAENLQAMGDASNIASAQFTALTKGMGDQTAIMDKLRQSTGGVITDMDLMTSSNQLLKTGVLSSTAELEKFLGGVEKLKPATEDMNSAIMSMSQMLQNQTTRGLNQFGLNVDQVKQRVDELKASGLSAADAFKQAVFEGMDTEINKLGDAATAAETPLKKLQTQLEDIKEAASSNFASGVEGIINYGDAVTAQTDRIARQVALLKQTGVSGQTDLQVNPLLMLIAPAAGAIAAGGNNYTNDQLAVAQQIIRLEDGIADGWKRATSAIQEYHDQEVQVAQNAATVAAQQKQFQSQYAQGVGGNFQGIYETAGIQMDQTLPSFLTQLQADAIKDRVDMIKADAKSMKDAFKDSITADQTSELDAAVKSADQLATNAQKAADAFKNLTLPAWFGQTNGGMQGEIEDQVLTAAKNSGMSDAKLAALQNALDLGDGRQTTASQAEGKFAASLVGLPPDVVNKAISNYAASIQAAAIAGLNSTQLSGSESYFAGMVGGGGSQKITIKPGQGLNEVMRQWHLTQAQLEAAGAWGNGVLQQGNFNVGGAGTVDPNFNAQNAVDQFKTSLGNVGQGTGTGGMDFAAQTSQSKSDFASMLSSSVGMSSATKQMTDSLTKISNMTFNWKINVSGLPPWLQTLMASGGIDFGGGMAKATQANGGVPPGSNSAKARGGAIVPANSRM